MAQQKGECIPLEKVFELDTKSPINSFTFNEEKVLAAHYVNQNIANNHTIETFQPPTTDDMEHIFTSSKIGLIKTQSDNQLYLLQRTKVNVGSINYIAFPIQETNSVMEDLKDAYTRINRFS